MSEDVTTADRRELLFGMYQENRCQARHYEAVRATIVSFTLGTAVAVSALIANGGLNRKDWPLAVVLAVIGAYGTVFTKHYFKLINLNEQLADEFCKELDLLFGTKGEVESRTRQEIQEAAMNEHKKKFAKWRNLEAGELFRMYWPITISILAVAVMLLKFSFGKLL